MNKIMVDCIEYFLSIKFDREQRLCEFKQLVRTLRFAREHHS